MTYELELTGDRSYTLRDEETEELYHNRAGAYSEALLNYTQPSGAVALAMERKRIAWLDVCYGLGYNTLVLLQELLRAGAAVETEAEPHELSIDITAIEWDAAVLNLVPDVLGLQHFDFLRSKLEPGELVKTFAHFGQSEIAIPESSVRLSVNMLEGDVRAVLPELAEAKRQSYDFAFHDPFSPKRVPELWTLDLFLLVRELLRTPHGSFLTYSSAGAVRGGLRQAGFHLWRTSALGGKSGGTLATLSDQLYPGQNASALSEEEEEKINSPSGVPYRDPEFSARRDEIWKRRSDQQEGFKER